MKSYICLSTKSKIQTLLVPGTYHGIGVTGESINDFQFPDKVEIVLGHDDDDKSHKGEVIGSANIIQNENNITFTYELFDPDLTLSTYSGWSAHLHNTIDDEGNAVFHKLRNIALLKDEPPAVQEAQIILRGEKIPNEELDKISTQVVELSTLMETMRLQLTELKTSMEKEEPPENPETSLSLSDFKKNLEEEVTTVRQQVELCFESGAFD